MAQLSKQSENPSQREALVNDQIELIKESCVPAAAEIEKTIPEWALAEVIS